MSCHFPGDYFSERGGLRQSAAGRDERMRVDTRDTEFRPSKNQTDGEVRGGYVKGDNERWRPSDRVIPLD